MDETRAVFSRQSTIVSFGSVSQRRPTVPQRTARWVQPHTNAKPLGFVGAQRGPTEPQRTPFPLVFSIPFARDHSTRSFTVILHFCDILSWAPVPSNECRSTGLYGAIKADLEQRSSSSTRKSGATCTQLWIEWLPQRVPSNGERLYPVRSIFRFLSPLYRRRAPLCRGARSLMYLGIRRFLKYRWSRREYVFASCTSYHNHADADPADADRASSASDPADAGRASDVTPQVQVGAVGCSWARYLEGRSNQGGRRPALGRCTKAGHCSLLASPANPPYHSIGRDGCGGGRFVWWRSRQRADCVAGSAPAA